MNLTTPKLTTELTPELLNCFPFGVLFTIDEELELIKDELEVALDEAIDLMIPNLIREYLFELEAVRVNQAMVSTALEAKRDETYVVGTLVWNCLN